MNTARAALQVVAFHPFELKDEIRAMRQAEGLENGFEMIRIATSHA